MRPTGLGAAALAATLAASAPLAAQHDHRHDHAGGHRPGADSAFAALQERGRGVMGVDQYASVHRFDDLPDGGRITLQAAPGDRQGQRAVREHLRLLAEQFAAGDFSSPAATHAEAVPGTAVLRERRAHVRYDYADLPEGGAVRITTRDAAALGALRAFMAYQRREHRAAGDALAP